RRPRLPGRHAHPRADVWRRRRAAADLCRGAGGEGRRVAGVTVVSVAPLRVEAYRELVRQALAEDIGRGDVTTAATVDDRQQARAELVAKSACVLAGLDVFCEALRQCDPHVEITRRKCDGDACEPGTVVAEVRGQAAGLLTGERTALNFIQRL